MSGACNTIAYTEWSFGILIHNTLNLDFSIKALQIKYKITLQSLISDFIEFSIPLMNCDSKVVLFHHSISKLRMKMHSLY